MFHVSVRQERRLAQFEKEREEHKMRQMRRQERKSQETEEYLLKQRVCSLFIQPRTWLEFRFTSIRFEAYDCNICRYYIYYSL